MIKKLCSLFFMEDAEASKSDVMVVSAVIAALLFALKVVMNMGVM